MDTENETYQEVIDTDEQARVGDLGFENRATDGTS